MNKFDTQGSPGATRYSSSIVLAVIASAFEITHFVFGLRGSALPRIVRKFRTDRRSRLGDCRRIEGPSPWRHREPDLCGEPCRCDMDFCLPQPIRDV